VITRVVSGLTALALLFAALYFFSVWGLMAFAAVGIAIGFHEYARLTFPPTKAYRVERGLFEVLCGFIFVATVFTQYATVLAFATAALVFLTATVWRTRQPEQLNESGRAQIAGLAGFVYVAFFPGLAIKLLLLPQGVAWLMGLLAIVFAGDTLAYFAGLTLGRHKLNAALSPKKTIEGSLGGLVGSAIAGFIMAHFFLPQISVPLLVGTALITGVFAQTGDLFESQIKRLAGVKDSGRIMPGHGGILDRLDGVYFGAPVYFSLVWYLTLNQGPAFSF
jgi:phosphatidate cytidylyltransferase